jgi:hypothetical protein
MVVAFQLFGPQMTPRVPLADDLLDRFAGLLDADIRAADPGPKIALGERPTIGGILPGQQSTKI